MSTGFLTSHAQNTVDVPIGPNDVLIIKGLDLQLSFTKALGSNLKIYGLDSGSQPGTYRAERKGNQILITMSEPNSKRDWKAVLAQKMFKKKVIEFRGPSLPVEIYVREAQVNINQWQHKVDAHLVSGKIISNQSRDLNFSLQKGDATIVDSLGTIKARVTQGQLTFKNDNFDADIQLQSGQLVLEKTKGNWNINTHNATVKATQSEGVLQLDNQKGLFNISKFKGRVDGQLRDGNINLSLLNDSDVNIKSKSGKMQIQVPQGGGAFLNLLSAEGDLYLPGDLKANRGGSEKSYRGRLRGESQKVSVTARSQEGIIILKY